jgi:hypothetical protein
LRIFVIHVYRRHWEFYPDIRAAQEPEEVLDVQQNSGLRWLQRKAAATWDALDGARTGVLGRARALVDKLNSRVDPTEPMLRHMRSARQIEVVYPSDISARFVQRRLRLLLLNKTASHRRWIYINSALLPLTGAMTLIPGPNVFFAWNAYRLFSHVLALRGGQRVLSGAADVKYSPNETLNEILDPEARLEQPLDVERARAIGERFELPGLVDYLLRAGGFAGQPLCDQAALVDEEPSEA